MKSKFRYIHVILIAFTIMFLYNACSEEDSVGTPRIDYIRVTKAEASDSLIVSAGQGQLIAIIGENLGKAKGITFNEIPAALTTTYITNKSILVRVPVDIPTELTNELVIYFEDNQTLTHEFTVAINKPSVKSMLCEFVNDGEIATIRGEYFYEPLVVTFPGELEAEIISVEDQTITVEVPDGALSGQILVKSNYGTGRSEFMFRDSRNIVVSSDPVYGWVDRSVSNPGVDDPEEINGSYIRVTEQVGAWGWIDIAASNKHEMGNIPDEAVLNPELYSLKFEVNTVKPYNGSGVRIIIGLTDLDHGAYMWNPPYDTEGNWQTVTIPFNEVVDEYVAGGSTMELSNDGYCTRITIFGSSPLDCDICFDNFRVVPNKY